MTLTRKLGIYAGLIAILIAGVKTWEWKVRQDERVRIAVEEASKREDYWRPVAMSRRAKLKDNVRTFNKQADKLKTLSTALAENKADTSLVATFIEQSDSTVKACRAVVKSCGETVIAQDSLISALTDLNEGLKKQLPGAGSKIKAALLWGAIGFVAGNIVTNARR